MIGGNFIPFVGVSAANNSKVPKKKDITPVASAAIPETDWSAVDWNEELVLPEDQMEYQRQVKELQDSGRDSEIKNLVVKKHKLSDDDIMARSNVPKDIREMVDDYKNVVSSLGKQVDVKRLEAEKLLLSERIASEHPFVGDKKLNLDINVDQIIDVKSAAKLKPKKLIPYTPNIPTVVEIKPKIKSQTKEKQSNFDLYNVTSRGLRDKADKIEKDIRQKNDKRSVSDLGSSIRKFFGIESASASTPIINYYSGIEKYSSDNALYYISNQQNADGSFGDTSLYENTAQVVWALSEYGRTNNDQYTAAVNYLKNTAPENIREQAVKARVLYGLGLPYQSILDDIIANRNKDGGYGLQKGYVSDVITTGEVVTTLWAGNYSIQDALPKGLLFISSQIPSDGGMRFTANSNPSYFLINFTAQYLYPFKSFTLANDSGVSIPLQPKINSLLNYLSLQFDSSAERLLGAESSLDESATINTWNIYQTDLDKAKLLTSSLQEKQFIDGSFDQSNLATLSALKVIAKPDLILTNLVSTGSLINKSQASFSLTIQNRGYAPAVTTTIYLFAESYNTGIKINLKDLVSAIEPNETITINFNISDTISYFGDVEIKMYAEDDGDINYDDNWIAKTFTFASAANNSPALQMFYMAGKHVIAGNPSLNVRWAKPKVDPNRLNYVIMWRQKGTTDWSFYGINTTWNGAFLGGGFVDGTTYEVTAGVLYNDEQTVTYFSNTTDVKTGAVENMYMGNLSGYITLDNQPLPNVSISGFGVNGKSDSNGNINLSSIPNGSSMSKVQTYQYDELYSTRFPIAINATTTGVRFLTHLKDDVTTPTISNTELRWASNYKVKNQKEYQLLTWGADNVAIKEGDFYLWNPNTQMWTFLSTSPVNSSGGNYTELKWYIPTDLPLGAGYKIKGNLRDYRGNESVFKEWGPFEIIDGTAPQFTVLFPNGGEELVLGTTNTIKWTTTSTNPVNTVSFAIEYPDAYSTLFSNKPNTGSFDWFIPFHPNFIGNKFKIRVSGADSVNNEYSTDSSDNYFTIKDPSPKPADPWAMPQYLFDAITSTAQIISRGNYQIDYDQNGVAHMVYKYTEDYLSLSPRVINEKLMYTKFENDAWTMPISIYEKRWETDSNLNGYQPIVNLKMKLFNGYPQLLWQSSYSGGCINFNTQEIYHYYFDGNNWIGPTNLSNNNTESRDPDFTIDKNGNVSAVWSDGYTWNDTCDPVGDRTSLFTSKFLSGGWANPTTLSLDQYTGYLLLATTADNKLHLVFRSGSDEKIKHTMKNGSTWSTPVALANGFIDNPSLQSFGNKLHYVYRERYTDPTTNINRTRAMYTGYDSSVWNTPEEVSLIADKLSAEIPRVTVSSNGQPQIIFQSYNSVSNKAQLVWTTKLPNNKWLTPQNIAFDSQSYFDGSGVVYGGLNNNLLAVWTGTYSYKPQIIFNTADLNIDYIWPEVVVGISATSTKQIVKVQWSKYDNIDDDFDHFNIYRSVTTSLNGLNPIGTVSNISSTEYTDGGLKSSSIYYYSVTIVDKSGHESTATTWSNGVDVVQDTSSIVDLLFEESGNGAGIDYSGNGNNATCSVGLCPVVGIKGVEGNTINFNGKDQSMSVANNSSLNLVNAVSVEAWIKPKNNNSDASPYEVVATKNLNYELSISKYGAVRYGIINENNIRQVKDSPNVLAFDSWNYVVMTYDGAFVRAYVNGELVSSLAQTGKIRNDNTALTIGQWDNFYHFNGDMDQVTVYNKTLSLQEIETYYAKFTKQEFGLLTYYKLDDSVGSNNFVDSSGNLINSVSCTGNGCPISGVLGRKDTAVLFDGKDDYLKLNDNNFINPSKQITIEAWIKPSFKITDPIYQVVATKNLNYELSVSKYGALRCGIINSAGQRLVKDIPNVVVNNRWNHIAMIYDGAKIDYYVNGEKVGTLPQVGLIRSDTTPLLIGQFDNYYWFDGVIDELKIYDNALSAADIKSHYDEFPLAVGVDMPLNLNLDENVGATLFVDQSANNNNAICVGGFCPTAGAEGKVNFGLNFDGLNDYLSVTSSDAINLIKSVSIEAWINPNFAPNDMYYQVVLTKDLNYELTVTRDGSLRTGITNQLGSRVVFNSPGVIINNQWSHIVMTYDGFKIRAYVNGVKVGEQSQTGLININDKLLSIGNLNNYYWFHGLMDNVKLYGVVLSDAEILDHYNNL